MLLTADLLNAINPVRFATNCGYVPDPFQAEMLTTTALNTALLCSRQVGKTTVTATLALHRAIFSPPSLTLIVSPSQSQSEILLSAIKEQYGRLSGVPEPVGEAVFKLDLKNGSKIRALSGSPKSARGYSAADLVIADEAAQIDDDMIAAIRPTLAVKSGQFVALSTPFGKRGWFFESWHSDNDWKRIEVTAAQCPRLSKEWLANELRDLGPLLYSQEYCNAWIDDKAAVFASDSIKQMFTDQVAPLWPESIAP